MKAAIIGANGQLGSDLVVVFRSRGWEVAELTHADIHVEDIDSVRNVLRAVKPDAVLNTAASHNVPRCEQDPAQAFSVNGVGALNVARVADDLGSAVVYYSTDYVFDGTKGSPYTEEDRPNPLNVYGVTKLSGEYFTLGYARNAVVARVSGIYGRVPCRAKGGNFVTTMIRAAKEKPEVKVVTDEVLSPTPTWVIAQRSAELLDLGVRGLVHLVVRDSCSWYEFARAIFDTMGFTTPLLPCSVNDFPVTVRRPAFSAMKSDRLIATPVEPMPGWREGLESFLRNEYR